MKKQYDGRDKGKLGSFRSNPDNHVEQMIFLVCLDAKIEGKSKRKRGSAEDVKAQSDQCNKEGRQTVCRSKFF